MSTSNRTPNVANQTAKQTTPANAITRLFTLGLCAGTLLWNVTAPATLGDYQKAVTNEASLISYYTFDKTNANDSFGPNNGTLQGTAKFAPGVGGGRGLLLDGHGWVALGQVPAFDFASGLGTVEAWVRVDWPLNNGLGYNPCMFADRNGGPVDWSVHMDSVQDGYGVWNGASYSPQPISPSPQEIGITGTNWHHVAVVWDLSSSNTPLTTLFWDGIAMGQTDQAVGLSSNPTQLGSSSTTTVTEGWVGMLDEVAFYSSALSSNAILAHYQAFQQDLPPVITAQPAGGTFLAGASLNLTVQALGEDLSYQWYLGSTAIAHATNSTLSIPSLAATDSGSYHVVVSCTAPVTNLSSSTVTVTVASSLPEGLASYQAAVKNTPGLISYYTFDDGNANDSVGSNNGTLAGTATLAPGVGGAPSLGVYLDGHGWVKLGRVPAFDFSSGTGSVEAWVQAAWPLTFSAYNPCLFADRDLGTINNELLCWSVHMASTQRGVGVWNGTSWQPQTIPAPGTNWHHLAIVWDNSQGFPTTTTFWDGAGVGETDQGLDTVGETTQLGSSTDDAVSEGWIGMLDEVAFYSTALSTNTVAAHYASFFTSPSITVQPVGGTFLPGVTLTLSVQASGPNLSYQWYMNSNSLAGAKAPTLTLPNLAAANAGTYYVVVSNPSAKVASVAVSVGVASPLPADLTAYQKAITSESSLISYYTFDDLNANDSVGANNGTLAGITAFGPGLGGPPGAGLLLGGQGRVLLGEVAAFDFASGIGTVEAWVQAGWPAGFSAYNPCLFANRDFSTGDNTMTLWSIHLESSKTGVGLWNGTTWEPQTIPDAGTNWHYLACVFDMTSSNTPTTTIFWDGVGIGQTDQGLGPIAQTTQLGSSSPELETEGWIGTLDEVAFYSSALSSNALAAHYAAFFGAAPPVITVQPAGGAFYTGQSLSMAVWASGAARTFQWFKNGSAIPGATNWTFGIASLAPTDAGTYYVTISTPGGSVTSAEASVAVGNYVSNYQATVLAEPSLIAYYTFDAGDARDSKGTNDGTAVGTVAYVTGVGGTGLCLSLNGTNDIELGVVPAFEFTDGSGTVEAWLQMDWSPNNGDTNYPPYNPCLCSCRNLNSCDWSIHPLANQQAIGDWNGAAYLTDPLPGNTAGWHHCAVTFGDGLVTIYWDGNPIGSNVQSVALTWNLPTQIGSSLDTSTREGWIGNIDEVALYSATLSSSAIYSHFLAMATPPQPPAISWSLSGTRLTLSWPARATGFTLESATSLPAVSWTPVSGVVNNQVTVDASKGACFYRLKK
jgi:hypothetical protein